MFIGLIISIMIIIFYAMHVSKKYVLKGDLDELGRRMSKLEEVNHDSSRETK